MGLIVPILYHTNHKLPNAISTRDTIVAIWKI